MSSNAAEPDGSGSQPDGSIAQAMDRVLEFERSAQATIAECERECARYLEHARQQRQTILDHAQARIVTLHTRAAKSLERCVAQIMDRGKQTAASAAAELADPGRRSKALNRLAFRLTGPSSERSLNGD